MRRLALALVLAALSGSAAAEWVVVNNTNDYVAYADPATIAREGNMVKMRDLIDLKFPRPSPYGRQHSSSTGNSEFDCQNARMRSLHFLLHSGQMGGGDIIETASASNQWLPVTPGSLLRILWQFACGK